METVLIEITKIVFAVDASLLLKLMKPKQTAATRIAVRDMFYFPLCQ